MEVMFPTSSTRTRTSSALLSKPKNKKKLQWHAKKSVKYLDKYFISNRPHKAYLCPDNPKK